MPERILLEQEQKELLTILVEAARNVPREQRQKFLVAYREVDGTTEVNHAGLSNRMIECYLGDIEMLERAGLIVRAFLSSYAWWLEVTPEGFAYYKTMKQQMGESVQRLESTIHQHLVSDHFQKLYPQAYQKWAAAETLLWGSDSREQLSRIGLLCREAGQEFATALVDQWKPANVDQDKGHTYARMRAVIHMRRDALGEKVKDFLDALLHYWGTTMDLIQRQVHAAEKEGTPIVWDDARRVVFQAAIVMFEIDRSLTMPV